MEDASQWVTFSDSQQDFPRKHRGIQIRLFDMLPGCFFDSAFICFLLFLIMRSEILLFLLAVRLVIQQNDLPILFKEGINDTLDQPEFSVFFHAHDELLLPAKRSFLISFLHALSDGRCKKGAYFFCFHIGCLLFGQMTILHKGIYLLRYIIIGKIQQLKDFVISRAAFASKSRTAFFVSVKLNEALKNA